MFHKSLYYELKSNALKLENKTAIFFGNHPISYKRLLDAIDRLANALSKLGVAPGDRFAILLPNIPQFVISFFAIIKLGATAVPVSPNRDQSTIEPLLRACDIKGIIALDRYLEPMRTAVLEQFPFLKVITLGDTFQKTHNLTNLIASSEPGGPEFWTSENWTPAIFHTAGASGTPRAVPLSERNIVHQVEAARRALTIETKDVVFGLLPFSNSGASVASMITPLLNGCSLVLFAKFELGELMTALQSHRNVLLVASNLILEELLERWCSEFSAAPKLCAAVCLTQMSARRRFEFQEKFGAPVIQSYGLTEAGPFVSVYDPRFDQKNDSVGFPTFGFQIKIVSAHNRSVDLNTVGEILIQSDAVARQYLNSAEAASSEPLTDDGWFRTGDLGKFDELGHLYVVGRKRDLIIKGGFEVYPNEIKDLLTQHPKVRDCSVFGVRDEILGQEIKAQVTPANSSYPSKEELLAFCRQQLPLYKCPKYIEIVNSLTAKPAEVVSPTPAVQIAESATNNQSAVS